MCVCTFVCGSVHVSTVAQEGQRHWILWNRSHRELGATGYGCWGSQLGPLKH